MITTIAICVGLAILYAVHSSLREIVSILRTAKLEIVIEQPDDDGGGEPVERPELGANVVQLRGSRRERA